ALNSAPGDGARQYLAAVFFDVSCVGGFITVGGFDWNEAAILEAKNILLRRGMDLSEVNAKIDHGAIGYLGPTRTAGLAMQGRIRGGPECVIEGPDSTDTIRCVGNFL